MLKTNKKLFFVWLIVGLTGYLVSYFVIEPMLYSWPVSYQFFDDLLYNLYKLFVANVLILPATIVALWGLIRSVKNKQIVWATTHAVGFIVLIILIIHFALPILFPAHEL